MPTPVEAETSFQNPGFYINRGPLSLAGRSRAMERDWQQAVNQYLVKAPNRQWDPELYPQAARMVMRQHGKLLSEDSVEYLLGSLGIESLVDDYAGELRQVYGGSKALMMFLDSWEPDERRHPKALRLALVESRVKTPKEVDEYLEEMKGRHFDPAKHVGLTDRVGALSFATFQEREVGLEYLGEHDRVRVKEYNLPLRRTDQERQEGYETGILEVHLRNGRDEIAHHGINLKFLMIHLRYFPDQTTEKVWEVRKGFAMPALEQLSNRRAFLRAAKRSGLIGKKIQEAEVFQPVLKALGLLEVEDSSPLNSGEASSLRN